MESNCGMRLSRGWVIEGSGGGRTASNIAKPIAEKMPRMGRDKKMILIF